MAFKSRTQLALHYKDLGVPERRKVWRQFISRIKKHDADRVNEDDIMDHIDDLAKKELNGRQIRNAITTARQLAQYKRESFAHAHLKHVLEVSGEFKRCLLKVKEGYLDKEVMRVERLR